MLDLNITNFITMDIQVLISKKGTAVVIASHLHRALGLKPEQFPNHCKKWLADLYEFDDHLRKPTKMKDFAERRLKDSIVPDYYLGIDLAKQITLRSNSKEKKKLIQYLNAFLKKYNQQHALNQEQIKLAFELGSIMCSMQAQRDAEEKHKAAFIKSNGKEKDWYSYRNKLTGINKLDLQDQLMRQGKLPGNKNSRSLLFLLDKYQLIRIAVIDLLKSIQKSDQFAKDMGDLALFFAQKQSLDIYKDTEKQVLQFQQAKTSISADVKVMDYFNKQAYSA